MNEFLATLYDTRGTVGSEDSSDVEKLAEAQILDGVLQSEGINVDDLDDGTILKLAYEIFGEDSHLVKSAADEDAAHEGGESEDEEDDEEEEGDEETSEEKTAEADLLGRIMAHSMVQELGNIELEKEAGPRWEAVKGGGKKALEALKSGPGKVSGKAKELAGKAGDKGKAMKGSYTRARTGKSPEWYKGNETPKGRLGSLLSVAKEHPRSVAGAGLGLLGASGGITAAALSGKKKKASAIDSLAEQRALEILAENGIDTEQDKLASAVEQRAWELLAANGYVE